MGWDAISADVFTAILLRIPLSPRRRLRLVCRHWRDVIDERMPLEPRAHAKVLVFFTQDDDPSRQDHHLTDVRGRLGLAVSCRCEELETSTTEVWVLEGGREESSWTWLKRFTMVEHGGSPPQKIALPHVVHGDHILTTTNNWGEQPLTLSAQLPREEGKRGPCLMRGAPRQETAVASVKDGSRVRTFAYVKTQGASARVW